MELFYESYLPATVAGIIILFLLLSFWYVSQKTWLLSLTAIPILIIGAGVLLDLCVETDTEAVWKTFNSVRAALIEGDISTIELYLTPEAKQTFNRAKWALDSFDIRRIGIYDLELEFNDYTAPPTAIATFQGVVKYRGKKVETAFGETYLAQFTVELEKNDNGVWLITNHIEYHN